jgi:hypothetical protein
MLPFCDHDRKVLIYFQIGFCNEMRISKIIPHQFTREFTFNYIRPLKFYEQPGHSPPGENKVNFMDLAGLPAACRRIRTRDLFSAMDEKGAVLYLRGPLLVILPPLYP